MLFPASEHRLISMLEPQHLAELTDFVAKQFRFEGGSLTPDEMKDALLAAGQKTEWESYDTFQRLRRQAELSGQTDSVELFDRELKKLVDRWTTQDPPLVRPKGELPGSVQSQLAVRDAYTSRFDPFVLAVEHEALYRGKLAARIEGARAKFVRFNHLDNDLAPKTPETKAHQEAETEHLMGKLGMTELGLIREFDLCRFTHGYSRVSAVPTLEKRGQDMPVRLRLFDPLRNGKRPIYVITQANEAYYVRLDPAAVYSWLQAVGVVDLPSWAPSESVRFGGRLLEVAQPFGRYFSLLRGGDASTYRYVYTLLHTYAHVVMKSIAEMSGLDLGSLGEYIFPLDLAFVVYRNGTTMDLGNLSALWRNEHNRFLNRLLEAPTYRCNSGRLCDADGGACPDCIMIPETSCIAQNQLLSRAVLRGGPAPREDETHKRQRIPGFLEVLNGADSL